jgi:hypothetical protein
VGTPIKRIREELEVLAKPASGSDSETGEVGWHLEKQSREHSRVYTLKQSALSRCLPPPISDMVIKSLAVTLAEVRFDNTELLLRNSRCENAIGYIVIVGDESKTERGPQFHNTSSFYRQPIRQRAIVNRLNRISDLKKKLFGKPAISSQTRTREQGTGVLNLGTLAFV